MFKDHKKKGERDSTSLALLTDLYQLTMAQGYFLLGMMNQQSCVHLFFRKKPFQGSYAVASGIESVLAFMEDFSYDSSDLDYLSKIRAKDGSCLFQKSFLDYLATLKITCDVDAVEEGTVIFPFEPLIRLTGPLLQTQLLETPLLNLVNFPTLIATKACRMAIAAHPDEVVEFGVRRAQGVDGAITASRAAYIGGCAGTSHVLAGKLFDIPVAGTQAHSWIMAHETEEEAFENFAKIAPSNCAFLIDTFDSVEGTKKAIQVAKKIQEQGVKLLAVRLDSGDLISLSVTIRKMLDEAGLSLVKIMATNDLDEYMIEDLKNKGAKIDIWGVGTNLVTAKDQSALDGVYKLSAIEDVDGSWKEVLKVSDSPSKTTDPGVLQVKRFFDDKGYLFDVICDENSLKGNPTKAFDRQEEEKKIIISSSVACKDLLLPMMRKGKVVYSFSSLDQIRKRREVDIKNLNGNILSLKNSKSYFVGLEESLFNNKKKLINQYKNKIKS